LECSAEHFLRHDGKRRLLEQWDRFHFGALKRMEGAGLTRTSAFWTTILLVLTSLAQAQNFKLLHTFEGADGATPSGDLARDASGNVYGVTYFGGSHGIGSVFKFDHTGKESVLYSFTGGSDGQDPLEGLRLRGGALYGTAEPGKPGGLGNVFRLSGTGKLTVLHTFAGAPSDGGYASSDLLSDSQNNFYGTTFYGGALNNGTVYKLDVTGNETVLYSFAGGPDGSSPSGLVRDSAGNLYGVTQLGGDLACNAPLGCGTVFKLDPKGRLSVLHSFTGPDGVWPNGLTPDGTGNFYGTTSAGGTLNAGTVFVLNLNGKERVLFNFSGGSDGGSASGALVRDANGDLYGATTYGGTVAGYCSFGCGVIFKLKLTGSTWTETVLHSFNVKDGASPTAPLLLDPATHTLYGVASKGGDVNCVTLSTEHGCGTLFKLTP
jgi:uncharacterized repeat protein (TIGR03803 family)